MLNNFILKLSGEIRKDLPGFLAQRRMAPLGENNYTSYFRFSHSPKISAVLILFYPDLKTQTLKTVLIERAKNSRGYHSGQISFPGGRYIDSDNCYSVTALREAEEEIGVKRNSVFLIGELTTLYIPVTNFLVHPFLGFCKNTPQFSKDVYEVEEILEVEINEFMLNSNKRFVQRYVRLMKKKIEVPCYKIGEKIIWGATAMIISELEEIVKKIS